MSAPERVDELMRQIAQTRPRLDDVTRARVAARLNDQLRERPRPQRTSRWSIAAASGLVAAAGIAAWAAMSTTEPPRAPLATLPTGTSRWVASDATFNLAVDDATSISVLGPGWVHRDGARVLLDAARAVVDRPEAGQPIELVYRGATVHFSRATFGISGATPRVIVIRGEVELRCADEPIPVRAGEDESCAVPAAEAAEAPPRVANAAPTPAPSCGGEVRRRIETPPPGARVHTEELFDPFTRPGTRRAVRSARPSAPVADIAGLPDAGPNAAADAPSDLTAETAAETPPAEVPPTAPAITTASDLYDRAEAHMRHRQDEQATAVLRLLIAQYNASPEATAAMLDLARLAARRRAYDQTVVWLDHLAARSDGAVFAEPADHLRCTTLLAVGDTGAAACLARYRRTYPRSPRDGEIAAKLIKLQVVAGDCAGARATLAELAARHPDVPELARARVGVALPALTSARRQRAASRRQTPGVDLPATG